MLPRVTHNHRYERHYDELSDQRRREAESARRPVSLPQAAYQGSEMHYAGPHESRSVWVWVPWTDGEYERLEAHAEAWNDVAVRVAFYYELTELRVTVWRHAVTNRVDSIHGLLQALPLPAGFELVLAYQQGPRIVAPGGAVLEAHDVWERDAWDGYRLASFPDAEAAKQGVPEVTGSGKSFAEARRDVEKWIVAHGARTAA